MKRWITAAVVAALAVLATGNTLLPAIGSAVLVLACGAVVERRAARRSRCHQFPRLFDPDRAA